MNSANRGSPHGADRTTAAPPTAHTGKSAENDTVDAGLKSQDHYRRALPRWRYALRQRLLPLIRWETLYLAYLQSALRTPALDSYFAITANLGTHTFFMTALPIMFWCGFPAFGKGLVRILAAGVFFSGWLKDMCSLPRPLSPPLHRITMSGSVALEYGFPSTHSANAVSVAVYSVLVLRSESNIFPPATTLALEVLAYLYTVSIVFGRLYCGMHGFLDVIVGSLLGAVIGLAEFYTAPITEEWMQSRSWLAPFILALFILILVRAHPEPVDDCPCFDDSVAFAGTIIGIEAGTWHVANSPLGAIYYGSAATFDLPALGWSVALVRIVFGVLIIFAWREVAKPSLLRFLPHLYRVIETHGWSLPRRFFVPASEYKDVPLHVRDDNVLPNVSDFPKMVRSIRGPGRGRSVSVGPQSAADAYETLAYRERRRRESLESENGSVRPRRSLLGLKDNQGDGAGADATSESEDQTGTCSQASGVQNGRLAEFEHMMGKGTVAGENGSFQGSTVAITKGEAGDELGEREMFSKLVKPRVRYDVEVVTKLVVYAGIGFLAVDAILIAFELVGLGAGHLPLRS